MITIDVTSALAPYAQVREQLREQIESGDLAPGTRLPTVRALAEELGLAVNTVARAYRELEALGAVATRGRAGTVVSGDGVQRAARTAAQEYADRATALGLGRDEALALVAAALPA